MGNLQFREMFADAVYQRADLIELLFSLVDKQAGLPDVERSLLETIRARLPDGDDTSITPYVHATLLSLVNGDLRLNEANDALFAAILKAPFGVTQVVRALAD